MRSVTERRLARLENATGPAGLIVVEARGETAAEAVARHFGADGAPTGALVVVIRDVLHDASIRRDGRRSGASIA